MAASLDITEQSIPRPGAEPPIAEPIVLRPPQSWRTMAQIGLRMLLHDRLKLGGILIGIVAASVLSNINICILMAMLSANTRLIDRGGADILVTSYATRQLDGSGALPDTLVDEARTAPGVAWAAPLLMGQATVQMPNGGKNPVTIIGTKLPAMHGGPWNIVAGNEKSIAYPDAMFFDDSQRERLGGLNLGSVREVGGHRVQVVGFTEGLITWLPPYTFASFDTAREILHVPNHQITYVMVGLAPGASLPKVLGELRARIHEGEVLSKQELKARTIDEIMEESGIGKSMGISTTFALLVGFIVVALTMFSAVLDHIREFGTLKAIGATNWDLAKLLLSQAVFCGLLGGLIGEGFAGGAIRGMRKPILEVSLPPWLIFATIGLMVTLACIASVLALLRMRKVEPVLVFRG